MSGRVILTYFFTQFVLMSSIKYFIPKFLVNKPLFPNRISHHSQSAMVYRNSKQYSSISEDIPQDQDNIVNNDNLQDDNALLYDALKIWRKKTADELNRPIYTVLRNDVLIDICRNRPASLTDFRKIKGVGKKTELYYSSIYRIINKFAKISSDDNPAGNNLDHVWDIPPKPKKTKKSTEKEVNAKDNIVINTIKPQNRMKISIEELSDDQILAAKLALKGQNLFISGLSSFNDLSSRL